MPDPTVEPTDGHDVRLQQEQEAEASRKGWIPKHRYTGDPEKWKDAATFLSSGVKFTQRLQDELGQVKKELAEFKGTPMKEVIEDFETMARRIDVVRGVKRK